MPRKSAPLPPSVVTYGRYSTTQQSDGQSEDRQDETNEAYAAKHGMVIAEKFWDRGLSGFSGAAEEKGDLGRMLAKIEAGTISRGSVVLTESLDRLSRQGVMKASNTLTGILIKGIDVVTTSDGKRYTEDSGVDIFAASGMQIGNHASSAEKSRRMAKTWDDRRGTYATNLPRWIDKQRDFVVTEIAGRPDSKRTKVVITGATVNAAKAAPVIRLCDDVQVVGMTTLAKTFNAEGLLTPTGKPWTVSAMVQIIRSRSLIGEQVVCKVVNKRRVPTGEVIKNAYPAIVDEGTWYKANAAITARQRGGAVNGRHSVHGFTNIFGRLAVCATCGGSMVIGSKARAKSSTFRYLKCANMVNGLCGETHFHRVDHAETDFLRFLGELVLAEQHDANDPATPIITEIDNRTAERERMQTALTTLAVQFAGQSLTSPMGRTLTKLAEDITDIDMAIKKLEANLSAVKSTTPPTERLDQLLRLIAGMDGVDGTPLAMLRSQVANAMPSVVKAIRFGFDYVDAPKTTGHRRVRIRKTAVPPKPVSRFVVQLVNDLPVALMPETPEAIRLVAALQSEPDRYVFRDCDVVDADGVVRSDDFSAVA